MSENEEAQVDEEPDAKAEELAAQSTAETESEEASMANAVDDKASQLTGAQGAAATDSPVADNRGPVAQAEDHLEDTNLSDDRETLKKLQKDM